MSKKLFFLLAGFLFISSSASAETICVKKNIKTNGKVELYKKVRVVADAECPKGFAKLMETEALVGPQGPQGEQGEKGEKGEKGDDGSNGTDGIDGLNFYDVDFLPHEQTLTGIVSGKGRETVSLQVPSGVELEIATPAECEGTYDEPTAPAGKLCIYPMFGIVRAERIPTSGGVLLSTKTLCTTNNQTWLDPICVANKEDGRTFVNSETECTGAGKTWDATMKICRVAHYDKTYCEISKNTWDSTKACFVNGKIEEGTGISNQTDCENFSHFVGEWRAKGCSDSSFTDQASCLAPKTATWVPGSCSQTVISNTDSYSKAGFSVVSPAGFFAARWAYKAPELF